MWKQPAPAPTGRRGRPPPSGADKIRRAAADVRRRATKRPNPTAEAAGLGPCELAPADPSYATKRPRHRGIYATINGKTRRPAVMSYHLTWVAVNGLIPLGDHGARYEFSHYCHQPCCVNPQHGGFETPAVNKKRERCRINGSHSADAHGKLVLKCTDNPPCHSLKS